MNNPKVEDNRLILAPNNEQMRYSHDCESTKLRDRSGRRIRHVAAGIVQAAQVKRLAHSECSLMVHP